ncbi:MAG: PQQ-binding-like beta-propeller repeat protein [Myxococcota bacterium]
MDPVNLILGDRWRPQLATLAQTSRRQRVPPRPVNLGVVGDVVDVVVGRQNITEHLDDEAIFTLLPDLADALCALFEGAQPKSIIELPRSPWELVLARDAAGPLLLSCLRVTTPRTVTLHDHPVDAASLRVALLRALTALSAGLREVHDALDVVQALERFDDLMCRLQALDLETRPTLQRSNARSATPPTIQGAVRFDHAVALSYSFDTTYHGAQTPPDYSARFDAHALLIRGSIELELRTRVRLCKTYPLLGLCELAQTLSNDDATGPSTSREHAAVRWAAPGVLRVGEARGARDLDIDPEQWGTTVRALAQAMLRELAQVYPALTMNARFESLSALFTRPSPPFVPGRIDRPAALVPTPDEGEDTPPSFPWSFEDVRALYPHVSWTLTRRGLRSAWTICGRHGVVVPHEGGVAFLDPTSGHVRMERALRAPPCAPPVLVGSSVAVPCVDRRVVWLKPQDGAFTESATSLPFTPWFLHAAGRDGALALARDGRRARVTSSTATASPLSPTGSGRRLIETRSGPIVAALYDDASVEGIDARGRSLWRVDGTPRARAWSRVTSSEDGVLLTKPLGGARGRTEVTLRDARTGEVRWRREPRGVTRAQPALLHGRALIILERDGQEILWACERGEVRWQLTLGEAHPALPASPVPVDTDGGSTHILLQTGDGKLRCVDAEHGQVLWSAPAPGPSDWVKALGPVIVRDCVLRVADALELRLLRNGELVYSFEGFIHHPERMLPVGALTVIFGEPRGTSEHEDVLYALQFGHFLAVLPPAP